MLDDLGRSIDTYAASLDAAAVRGDVLAVVAEAAKKPVRWDRVRQLLREMLPVVSGASELARAVIDILTIVPHG